ncbi:YceI family protein [Oleiharenicola sp. Vm1]|uniref:YceI family protein n=1 Tax=Oleiharenicola sp. Vm1 TaxID=3398393 RepID=UPI0039F4EAFD
MKRLLTLLATLTLVVAVRADAVTYKIDPVHSSVGFSLRHLFSKFSANFTKLNGAITFDAAAPEKSHVEATVEIGSVNTADDKRNAHVLSADFFDAAKFPTAHFVSKSWTKTGEGTFDVTGDLTIKDVTKPVTLKVTLLGTGPGMRGATTSGWEATVTIKKSEFGVAGPAMLSKALGDDVALTISVEANHKPEGAEPAKKG